MHRIKSKPHAPTRVRIQSKPHSCGESDPRNSHLNLEIGRNSVSLNLSAASSLTPPSLLFFVCAMWSDRVCFSSAHFAFYVGLKYTIHPNSLCIQMRCVWAPYFTFFFQRNMCNCEMCTRTQRQTRIEFLHRPATACSAQAIPFAAVFKYLNTASEAWEEMRKKKLGTKRNCQIVIYTNKCLF